jgi:hypothetical protein
MKLSSKKTSSPLSTETPNQIITLDMISGTGEITGISIKEETPTETPLDTHPEGWKEIEGDNTPEPETPPMEEIKTLTSISPKGTNFLFRDPSQMGPITYTTPTSKRMDELMILKLDKDFRTSGDHPNLKKTPKWMINPKFNGKERWMDLTKIHSFNLEYGLIILSRSEIQHRGMEGFIEGPFIQIETPITE